MAGALSLICLFLITVCGLLLFRPVQVNTITDYSEPKAIQERQEVAAKMAVFLEKNPQIVQQERLESLPNVGTNTSTNPTESASAPATREVVIQFQNSQLQFRSLAEYDQWVYENVRNDPSEFLKQIHSGDDAELYLDTLKKVTEINPTEEVANEVKSAYMNEAKDLISNSDGYHQQMTQKALQHYLDLEKDKTLGKKTVDDFLKAHQH